MLHFTAVSTGVFVVIAIIAGIFGYGGIALGAAEIARTLFFLLLAIFAVSLIAGMVGKNRRRSSWHSTRTHI